MGKYDPLYKFLSTNTLSTVQLSYKEIEKILSFALPASAYIHRAWWSNFKGRHPHCKSWQDAGYTVVPNLSNQTVVLCKGDKVLHSCENKVKLDDKITADNNTKTPQYIKMPIVTPENKPEEKPFGKQSSSITLNGYTFYETHFSVEQVNIQDAFLNYNKYTLEEMLAKDKFKSLKGGVIIDIPIW